MHPKFKTIFFACLAATGLIFTSCAPTDSDPPVATRTLRTGSLTPYQFNPPTQAVQATPQPTITPLPSPTPTPRTHQVQKGEDMFGIALRYGVSLEELMAANPEVKPNAMSIGAILVIPGTAPQSADSETPSAASTATPLPVTTGQLFCVRTREEGVWCSLPVTNSQAFALEGLVALIRLVDTQTQETINQKAFLNLDLLPAGKSLPLTTYFPAPVPASFQASAEIISSLPNPADGRYLPARLENQAVFLSADRLTAEISLEVFLDEGETPARRVWVAATAYDGQGNAIGVRRWENSAGQSLVPGQAMPVSLRVYSNSGPIDRVDLSVETRP